MRNVVCYVVSSIRGYQYAVTPQKEGKRKGGEEWGVGAWVIFLFTVVFK